MKITEKFICGKNKQNCEDALYISEKIVAVIDGVTAKGDRLWNGFSSGKYAADCIVKSLKELESTDDILSAKKTLSELNGYLEREYKKVFSKKNIKEMLRASLIYFNSLTNEIISYGDCQCIINGRLYTHTKKIDEENAKIRSEAIKKAIKSGMDEASLGVKDIGRDAIKERLVNQFSYENILHEYGYPVLNGDKIEESFIVRYRVKKDDEIILASDGYPFLCESLKASEKKLLEAIEKDPYCYKIYPSTKGLSVGNESFDDRCFVKFTV